jgi:hypothetical protein
MQNENAGQSINVNEEVKNSILGAIPERITELNDLWNIYAPNFFQLEDKTGFHMKGGAFGIVSFTNRTMLQIWILGHAVQRSFVEYSGLFFYFLACIKNFDTSILEKKSNASDINYLIQSAIRLKESENINDVWPIGVPRPEDGRPKDESKNVYDMMAFDLNCMVAAFIFLHEVHHVQVRCPTCGIKYRDEWSEEHGCDEFAKNFFLDHVKEFSDEKEYPLDKLISKRAMCMGVAFFVFLIITPEENKKGTTSHPPVSDRILNITKTLNIPENDPFWNYLSCLIFTKLNYEGVNITNFKVNSFKDMCNVFISYLIKWERQ